VIAIQRDVMDTILAVSRSGKTLKYTHSHFW